MTPGTSWQPSDEFLDRVKAAYRRALKLEGRPPIFSIWRAIAGRQHDVHLALMRDDNAKLRSIFSDPASTDLFYGVDNLARSIPLTKDSDIALEVQARQMFAAAELHDQTFSFPNPFAGEAGFDTGRGVASYRAVLSAAQALRMKELSNGPILEIGPGLGRVALHARQIGLSDYTTVDLPMGIVAQACFLGAAIGENYIWFATDTVPSRGRVRILSFCDVKAEARRYSVVLNADSFVEMDPFSAMAYAVWIRRSTDMFYSINHDYRRMKMKYISAVFFRKATSELREYTLRPGYTNALYIFSNSKQMSA